MIDGIGFYDVITGREAMKAMEFSVANPISSIYFVVDVSRARVHVAGISDWEDFGLISQVLATSQEEYLDSLRRQKDKDADDVGET